MKKIILSLVCLLAAVSSYAAKTAKAVVSTDKKTLTFYYDDADHSSEGKVCALNEGVDEPEWYDYMKTVTTAVFDESFRDARPKSTYKWFYFDGYDQETDEKISSALTEVKGIENLNTSEVTNIGGMFYCCKALTSLDLSHFNTAKVTNMGGMFYSCKALTSLDLSSFNTAKVTNMNSMFYNCQTLTTIDLSNFNTANVTSMSYMFRNCTALTSLDLSNFNIDNVTNIATMFSYCSSLKSLNLSSFNTAKVEKMGSLFSYCPSLTTIYVSENFVTTNVKDSEDMFSDCTSLVGGAGTTFNSSYTDATYAKIDGGTGAPGYFTKADPAAISGISADVPAYNAMYSLSGQKVDDSYKGIVIINGKKIMKK